MEDENQFLAMKPHVRTEAEEKIVGEDSSMWISRLGLRRERK